MLEIIFNNITYDLSYVLDLPINNSLRQFVTNNTTNQYQIAGLAV